MTPPGPDLSPTTPHQPELETLTLALRRGDDVLGSWYEAAFPAVLRLARGFLASRDDAEDVAQEVLIQLVDSLDRWDPSRPLGPWLKTIVLHRCRNRNRAASRRNERESVRATEWNDGALPTPDEALAAGELSQLLDRALGLLPAREREVFVLVELEGTKAVEAAEVLGVAASTARAALTMARRRLRDALSDYAPQTSNEGGVS